MDRDGAWAEAEKEAAWEEYESWQKTKARDLRNGTIALLAGPGLFMLVVILARKIAPGASFVSIDNPIFFLSGLVSVAAGTWGSFKLLDGKGQSRSFWLNGIFAIALADKNRREAPNKPMTGIKPEG